MEEKLLFTVGADDAGVRLDKFLAKSIPGYSRSYLKELIAGGRASVGNLSAKPSRALLEGETVELLLPEPEEIEAAPEDIPLDIIYEDEDIIVVNKPKGMSVHPAPGCESGTLVNALLWHCRGSLSGINGALRPGIVHRIDKDTTGSIVACKNDAAHRSLAEQFAVHSIKRVYRGIVCGNIRAEEGFVEGNIGRDPKNRKRMAVVPAGGKEAYTSYKVEEHFASHACCTFRLKTGRTHQIRVHMKHIKHPLLGDALYGGASGKWKLEGQTLHAETLGFIHPSSGEYVEFAAPLPDYFQKVLGDLRRT